MPSCQEPIDIWVIAKQNNGNSDLIFSKKTIYFCHSPALTDQGHVLELYKHIQRRRSSIEIENRSETCQLAFLAVNVLGH